MLIETSEKYFNQLYDGVDPFHVFFEDAERLGLKKKHDAGRRHLTYPRILEPPKIVEEAEKSCVGGLNKSSFVYGEIKYLPFAFLLKELDVGCGGVFVDLGSGSGKPVFTAALTRDFDRLVGVEYLPALTSLSKRLMRKYYSKIRPKLALKRQKQQIEFVNADFLTYDFSDADVLFIASTTFDQHLMEVLARRCEGLKNGSTVITLSKKLDSKKLRLTSRYQMQTSWSPTSEVNIYKKIN